MSLSTFVQKPSVKPVLKQFTSVTKSRDWSSNKVDKWSNIQSSIYPLSFDINLNRRMSTKEIRSTDRVGLKSSNTSYGWLNV